MKVDNIFNLLGLVVVLAIVTDVVTSKNSAQLVTNSGNAFSGVIHSALGH